MTLEQWRELSPDQARRTWRGALAASRYVWWAMAVYEMLMIVLGALGLIPFPGDVFGTTLILTLLALGAGGFTALAVAGGAYAQSINERLTRE